MNPSGIFSYADLVANLNGLRFWNSILARKPDPIQKTVTVRPYIGCTNGKWKRLREFHWTDYVDPAWDEAVNCNIFARCPPWRAKRRRVVPGSREATRETRRAEGAKGDPKGASERGVQSYGRPVCSRNELAMLWRNAG